MAKWKTSKWQRNALKNIKKPGIHPRLSKKKIKLLRETLEKNEGSIHGTYKDTRIGMPSIRKYGMDIIERYRRKYQI